jgi:S1-C subfamily serine protease
MGDSSELEVGRKVLAIGNPFGLDTSLSIGVVSALGREIESTNNRTIRNVIQTDAAINPGNSGGPLLNSLGQLVGVNAAIFSPNGASAGVGFAIPVNTVKEIVPQLISYGRLYRPVIGVELASDRLSQRYHFDGLPIVRVFPGMPAATAGMSGARKNYRGEIVLGDIIKDIDGTAITNNDDYLSYMEKKKPGDQIVIRTSLHGQSKQYQLELVEPQ